MNEKYLSIITNFGCHWQCPYCIVRNNLENELPKTTIESLDNFQEKINEIKPTIVSISGGGDPLFDFENHKDYYDKLFSILKKNNLPFELHTSYINSSFDFTKCVRVVYHLRDIQNLNKIKRQKNEIVRVVFVVTQDISKEDIIYISNFVKSSSEIDELSFRQMVDRGYVTKYYNHDFLKKGHEKDWFYIEQNDYNTYFVNGETKNTYEKIIR